MQPIVEAGLAGLIIAAVFVVGTFAVVARRQSANPWALALLAVGQVGAAVGQRAVSEAVHRGGSHGLALLNQGTCETSSNLLLAGAAALILIALAAARRSADAPQERG
jgi:hypothetical protein